ncbi:MAG TPA: hypothetical protein VMX58_08625 [Patescibacteria group bacterium]|nr:hypothetical protein [Patescibacteria group bacterium]
MRTVAAISCIIVLLLPAAVYGDKYAGEFMALGGGARAMAMGGAFAAIADDATATFWNPAGLAYFDRLQGLPNDWQMIFMHSERFGDLVDYNYFSAAFPLRQGESGWGVTFIHLGVDDIRIIPWEPGMIINDDGDDRIEWENGEIINFDYTDFPLESANDFALFASYGQNMSFGAVGASVKLIRNNQVTGVSSFGIGLDFGFMKSDLWRDLLVGVKLQDATGTYISWSTGNREYIYPALKIGLAYPFFIRRMDTRLLFAVDGDFRYENRRAAAQFWMGRSSADFHVGAELVIRDIVSLRGGLDMGRPTAGAGFILRDFGPWGVTLGLDYALLVHDVLDTTHRVSLLLSH